MIPNESTTSRIALLRQKLHDGTITDEELKEGLQTIREGRAMAAEKVKVSRAKKAPIDGDKLLDGLLDL